MLENEIEKLNDKHASLNSEHDKTKSRASQILEENQKLKCDMSAILKENCDMKETISKLIKGKQSLDQVLSIPINFQKEGLGYTLNQRNAPTTKNPISFVKATNCPSTSQYPLRIAPKIALKNP